jgi:hypothetical protein
LPDKIEMKKQLICLVFIIPILFFGLESCGIYSLSGASVSPDVKTVYVKTFTNQSSIVVPSLAENMSEKLKDKFLKEMNLTLVDADGDLSFAGSVIDYRITPSSISSNDQAKTSRLIISVKVRFENTKEPKNNYETIFSSYMDFDSSKDLSQVEKELINNISDILVQDIFNKAVNNW